MEGTLRRGAVAGLAAVLVVAGSAAGTLHRDAAARGSAAAANVDWPRFGNTTDNTRYSTLTQITPSNVSTLGFAWTAQEGKSLSTFETYPVVVKGIMYYTTNTDQVRAVDAATGKLKWQYTPTVNFYHAIAGGGGGVPTNRGVEVGNGRVYLLTFDDQLIALQQSTGEKVWSSTVADATLGYSETSPPLYWNGMLFVGSAESDAGLRGFVAAYDANTGKQRWRFYTVPAPGQGWMPAQGQHGGGDVWMPQIIDPTTGILYFGTGNPSPDFDNRQRPGCNPWVNATMAIDARTGKMKWAHTEFCNDVWDYDSHQPPMLFNLKINGKTVRAVGHGNKSSLYYVYNAATGQVISKSTYVANWSTPHLKPSPAGVKVCPTAVGGFEYSPPAFSPQTQYAYEPGLETCGTFTLAPQGEVNLHQSGGADFGGTFTPTGAVTGFMSAINTVTGKIAWKIKMPKAMVGGAMTTASGLVFSGSDDGRFYAFDARTGKILWSANLGLAFGAAPITYAVNGTQYIAIAAGGASVSSLTGGTPGGTIAVFKLNGSAIHKLPPVTVPATSGVNAQISLKGLTKINNVVYMDAKLHRVVFNIIAAQNSNNSGFNFNGYARGAANYIVPAGWNVDWIFANDAALPHSAAVTASLKPGSPAVVFGLTPAETPAPQKGIAGGNARQKQYVGFAADKVGKFYLVCLVPGHIQAGMWDYFTVSTSAKTPALQTK